MEAEATTVHLACKAILFDMDGTLVNSNAVVQASWEMWSAKYKLPLEELLAFSHGRPTESTMEHFLPGRDHTADLKELAAYEEMRVEGILAIPGAVQLVQALQHHPWAIVTSAWRTLAEARVTAAGFPLPRVLVPVDEIRRGKPDPEGFLKAAEQLGVKPDDCVIFEDTRPGIEAGLSAGMQAVGILTTVPADHLKHTLLIRDFHDVAISIDGDLIHLAIRNRA